MADEEHRTEIVDASGTPVHEPAAGTGLRAAERRTIASARSLGQAMRRHPLLTIGGAVAGSLVLGATIGVGEASLAMIAAYVAWEMLRRREQPAP